MIEIPEGWRWNPIGVGFLPFNGNPVPYDRAYFEKYVGYAQTPQGAILNKIRLDMVCAWTKRTDTVLDVGIGAGCFVSAMRMTGYDCFGSDINPVGQEWLRSRGLLWGGDRKRPDVVTFWDVLEHIEDASDFIRSLCATWIFVCMPIFKDETHALTSKHFRPGEHCWYFTRHGLMRYLLALGYECVELHCKETIIGGREDIWSFAFKRIK